MLVVLVLGLVTSPRFGVLTRRTLLATAAAALPWRGLPADAAVGPAVDAVAQIGELSMQARLLQNYVRDAAPASRATNSYEPLQREVRRSRRQLQSLVAAMDAAAPDLKICSPEVADCDCTADPRLMQAAAEQVQVVRVHLASLDTALASGAPGFAEMTLNGGALRYSGGAVERELEEITEAADLFLDLAAGRPLMTARLAPFKAPTATVATPRRLAAAAARAPSPRACASSERPPLFEEELNLIFDSKCGVCQWEVDFLRERDSEGRLRFTDLEALDFEEGVARNGYLDYESALASFHAVRRNGELLSGMPVFQVIVTNCDGQ